MTHAGAARELAAQLEACGYDHDALCCKDTRKVNEELIEAALAANSAEAFEEAAMIAEGVHLMPDGLYTSTNVISNAIRARAKRGEQMSTKLEEAREAAVRLECTCHRDSAPRNCPHHSRLSRCFWFLNYMQPECGEPGFENKDEWCVSCAETKAEPIPAERALGMKPWKSPGR